MASNGGIRNLVDNDATQDVTDRMPGRHRPTGTSHSTNFEVQPSPIAQIRMQLRQRFFELHFGPTRRIPPMFVHIAEDVNIQMGAVSAAMDTLCIAQLATTFHDQRLAKRSSIMYVISISYLNREMRAFSSNNPAGPRLDEILSTIDVLISCSWFACVAAGRQDWICHMKGMSCVSVSRSISVTRYPRTELSIGGQECSVSLSAMVCALYALR